MPVPFHGDAIVKVVDVVNYELGMRSGDGTVEETFGGCQACALSCGNTREIESVATHGDTDTVHLVFVGSHGGNEAPIGDLSAGSMSMDSGLSAYRHHQASVPPKRPPSACPSSTASTP